MPNNFGKIYFIPVPLGNNEPKEVLPQSVFDTVSRLDEYIVENEKTARRFIKKMCPELLELIMFANIIILKMNFISFSTVKESVI